MPGYLENRGEGTKYLRRLLVSNPLKQKGNAIVEMELGEAEECHDL